MATIFNTSDVVDLKSQFKNCGVVYGVSVGRRQPMHLAHLDCIKEIFDEGLVPVIVIGSDNLPENPFYNPIKNPLDIAQMKEQIKIAMKSVTDNYKIVSIPDFGDSKKWSAKLADILKENEIEPSKSEVHFRKKLSDSAFFDTEIKPLSEYQQDLTSNGMNIWISYNKNKELDNYNSSDFRTMDIYLLKNSKALVAPEYIFDLAIKAREKNQTKTSVKNTPISMLDISLAR